MAQRTLFTIGHSTRTWAEFIALLKAWKIEGLVDVRTLPRSRAFPWFTWQRMAHALPKAGITYAHIPALGGLRRFRKDSVNTGWRNARFRAYADFMQTAGFEAGLRQLNEMRKKRRVCVMCSEALWWRCHRRMIADAEVARGIPVKHIMSATSAPQHELTAFAVVKKPRGQAPVVTYRAARGKDAGGGHMGGRLGRPGRHSMTRTKSFAVGDHVEWNSEVGRVRGTIKKKITAPMRFKSYTVHASKDEPQFLIRSDTTDHMAMHKGSALRRIRKRAGRGKKTRQSRR